MYSLIPRYQWAHFSIEHTCDACTHYNTEQLQALQGTDSVHHSHNDIPACAHTHTHTRMHVCVCVSCNRTEMAVNMIAAFTTQQHIISPLAYTQVCSTCLMWQQVCTACTHNWPLSEHQHIWPHKTKENETISVHAKKWACLHSFFTMALCRRTWSASCLSHINPGTR